jgi:acrylyl-CoA reductase (NADPH)
MNQDSFTALIAEQRDGKHHAEIREVPVSDLPEGDVLISVAYSSLNYKDGLAVTGKGRTIRSYPMVPGVDLAGTVLESQSPDWTPGDQVVLTGWETGESHWGGFAQLARAKSEWLVRLPEGLTMEEAMGIGTAGLTAMLCLMALEKHGLQDPVVVTGAAGGVGSMAIAILAQHGRMVVASTGRTQLHDYLIELGASEIIGREELAAPSKRPMENQRWGGAVDSVGGSTLAGLIRTMKYGCAIAACGLTGGNELETTVFPFILRAVSLLGVDSNYAPIELRREAWERLARDLPKETLRRIMQTAPLEEVPRLAEQIVAGQVRGRVVVGIPPR